jgi:hypothetical protein
MKVYYCCEIILKNLIFMPMSRHKNKSGMVLYTNRHLLYFGIYYRYFLSSAATQPSSHPKIFYLEEKIYICLHE